MCTLQESNFEPLYFESISLPFDHHKPSKNLVGTTVTCVVVTHAEVFGLNTKRAKTFETMDLK